MNFRSRKTILTLSLIVIIILIIAGFFILLKNKKPEKVIEEKTPVFEEKKATSTIPLSLKQALPEEERETINLATAFAEKYGSYDNKTNFKNITDLRIFMTDSFREKQDAYVKANILSDEKVLNSSFYKIKTEAIEISFEKKEKDFVSIKINILKQEQKEGQSKPKIFYENVRIELVKENGKWKINNLFLSKS